MNLKRASEQLEARLDNLAKRLADPNRPSPLPAPDEIRERLEIMEAAEALGVAIVLLGEGNNGSNNS